MFKRIKTIKNVGRFINCPNTQLGKIVLIYGPNCYGKSTLSDIFRSLDARSPEPILKRKSIGQNISDPEVNLTFITDQSSSENDITFINGVWQLPNFNYHIEIFDSRFIEDNVFTGLTIPRSSKENLTNLILGEQSVGLARQIKILKQKCFEKSKEIGDIEDSLKRALGILDLGLSLEKLIQTEKPIDISVIKSRIASLQEAKKRLEKSIAERDKIISLEVAKKLNAPNCFSPIEKIKDLLQKDFQNLNNKAYKKLEEHIKSHIRKQNGMEEQWIKEGVRTYLKTDQGKIEVMKCPFCSQSLGPVKNLIQIYQTLFSNEYEGFCGEIETRLDTELKQLEESERLLGDAKILIANNFADLQKYREYIDESDSGVVESIEGEKEVLKIAISSLQTSISEVKKEIHTKQQEKIKKPFLKIEIVFDLEEIKNQQSSLCSTFTKYNNSLETISENLSELKKKSEKNEFGVEIEKISQLLRDFEIKLKRYELSSDIEKLLLLRTEKKELEAKKEASQDKLEQNNRTFVEKYFEETTAIFNILGSVDFKIKPYYTRRGGQPVYEPIIEFNKEEITDDRISYVFSDADRRALAFSIFLARIKKKPENDLKNTIIILDDPVISYDDNRISQTFIQIKSLAISCRQLIILAHHSRFLLDTYEKMKDMTEIKINFLEIKREMNGSIFDICDDPKTRLDPYAQEIEKAQRFITGDSTINATDVRRSLRPILQKELEWRYRIPLKGVSYNGLGALVDKLKENQIIEDGLAREIYDFNDVLKEDHHDVDQSQVEDTRSLAKSILDFIYQKLNP